MRERRKVERFSLELPAKITVVSANGKAKETINFQTENISAAGAFFPTSKPLPTGTRIIINLVLPFDKPKRFNGHSKAGIKLEGTVQRSTERGMAVAFDRSYQITPLTNLK
jgi:hypothetical protein